MLLDLDGALRQDAVALVGFGVHQRIQLPARQRIGIVGIAFENIGIALVVHRRQLPAVLLDQILPPLDGIVNREMRHVEEERAVLVLLNVFGSLARHHVGQIFALLAFVAVQPERCVVTLWPAFVIPQRNMLVEPVRQRIGIALAEVPLADDRRRVTVVAQSLGHGDLLEGKVLLDRSVSRRWKGQFLRPGNQSVRRMLAG